MLELETDQETVHAVGTIPAYDPEADETETAPEDDETDFDSFLLPFPPFVQDAIRSIKEYDQDTLNTGYAHGLPADVPARQHFQNDAQVIVMALIFTHLSLRAPLDQGLVYVGARTMATADLHETQGRLDELRASDPDGHGAYMKLLMSMLEGGSLKSILTKMLLG